MNAITIREHLMLLLIAKSHADNDFRLVMLFDRADFPGKVGESINILLKNKLIIGIEFDKHNHPIKYTATNYGEEFLNNIVYPDAIIEYVKNMENPDIMLALVKKLITPD